MKTKAKTIGAVILAVGFLLINFNNVYAEVGIKYLGGVHGPLDNTSLSPSFTTFRTNRGNQMLAQIAQTSAATYSVSGSGYNLSAVEALNYAKMVYTPSFESWHGVAGSNAGEHGNVRYDEGFYIYINGGTFIPSQVSVNTKSEIWSGSVWFEGGGINITATLGTVHSARIRMNAGPNGIAGDTDDQKDPVQTGTLPSTGFVFLSPAVALGAYGSGNDQQKIQNAINYMTANKLRLVHYVNCPSTLGTFNFTKINEAGGGPPVVIKVTLPLSGGNGSLDWIADGQASVVQRSYDLLGWADIQPVWYPIGQPASFPVSQIAGQPKVFWRLKRQ